MRNIGDVIDAVKEEANNIAERIEAEPEGDFVTTPEKIADLQKRLDWVRRDAGFKAPEQMRDCWGHLMEALAEGLGNSEHPQNARIVRIMQGQGEDIPENVRI